MTTDILKANTISMIEMMDRKEIELARQAISMIFTMKAVSAEETKESLRAFVEAVETAIQ